LPAFPTRPRYSYNQRYSDRLTYACARSVTFEPESGVLGPGERGVVRIVLQGGKASERMRGRLACRVGLGVACEITWCMLHTWTCTPNDLVMHTQQLCLKSDGRHYNAITVS
jgi:hypothetical protein